MLVHVSLLLFVTIASVLISNYPSQGCPCDQLHSISVTIEVSVEEEKHSRQAHCAPVNCGWCQATVHRETLFFNSSLLSSFFNWISLNITRSSNSPSHFTPTCHLSLNKRTETRVISTFSTFLNSSSPSRYFPCDNVEQPVVNMNTHCDSNAFIRLRLWCNQHT